MGLEVPADSRTFEIKPYAIGSLNTDRTVVPPISNDGDASGGVDVKYGLTENLTADFTYNTDFAQVEVDEQQINLTRFSLFFPEEAGSSFWRARASSTSGGWPASAASADPRGGILNAPPGVVPPGDATHPLLQSAHRPGPGGGRCRSWAADA